MTSQLPRRAFLSATFIGALPLPLIGCRGSESGQARPTQSAQSAAGPGDVQAAPQGSALSAPSANLCLVTEPNIEGPYYRGGAPMRRALVDQGIRGVPLVISGRVLSQDCKTPLGEVLMDVWQADAEGRYDNDGTFGRGATPLRLRGKLVTDASGAYSVQTILPGRYLNGGTYRPAHVHVKLSAHGHQPITTQLYFPDDPYNAGDPFIRKSLIMKTLTKPDRVQANYDFVLPVA